MINGDTKVSPADQNKIKVAKDRAAAANSANPTTAYDANTVAGTVAAAIAKGKGPVGSMNTSQQAAQGSTVTLNNSFDPSVKEDDEGKMGYPVNVKPKRDRDPRHPENKGVSARRGFVGG